jgi:hypothetical protein
LTVAMMIPDVAKVRKVIGRTGSVGEKRRAEADDNRAEVLSSPETALTAAHLDQSAGMLS